MIIKAVSSSYLARENIQKPHGHRDKAQRGFKRYQAAWDEAVNRRNHGSTIFDDPPTRESPLKTNQVRPNTAHHFTKASSQSRYASPAYGTQEYVDPDLRLLEFPECREMFSHQEMGSADTRELRSRYMIQPALQSSLRPVRSHYSQQQPPSRVIVGREDVMANPPLTERLVHCREGPSLRGTPTYFSKEQMPPQVVRGSPSQGLKDMLVPSIETSSDGSSERREFSHGGAQQDAYSRRRMLSPPPQRQVIVIDDSPEIKRRRVFHHDDMLQTVRQSEFPVSSSVHSRDFIAQPRQRMPVYDAAPSDCFPYVQSSRDLGRRYERDDPRVREFETARSVTVPDSRMDKQRDFPEPLRYAGNSSISRPLAGSKVFHHEYPEPRVISSITRGRDDLISFPDHAYGNSVAYRTSPPLPEDLSDRSFITIRRAQDFSPRPIEKPL